MYACPLLSQKCATYHCIGNRGKIFPEPQKKLFIHPPQHAFTTNNPATGLTPALAVFFDDLNPYFLRQAMKRLAGVYAPATLEAVVHVFLYVMAAAVSHKVKPPFSN
jgi:hypothetical protein